MTKSIRLFGYALGKAQTTNPWSFVLGAIIVTLALLPGIPLLLQHVEPSLEKVLPNTIREVTVMNDMRSQFGADMFYVVVESENGRSVLERDALVYIDTLTQAIRTQEQILEALSIADIIKAQADNTIPLSKHQIDAITTQNPMTSAFVNRDKSITFIRVKADTGASAQQIKKVISDIAVSRALADSKNPYLRTTVTGFNAIDYATFNVIISDFSKITIISFLLMIGFLLIYYRFSIKKTIYSFVIMILSLLWTLGVVGYLGISLNVVTMVSAAMIMALGSSYGINSVYHFYDDFLLQYPKSEAIAKFQEFLIIGLTGSALAEIAGFSALLFGQMPAMHSLGIILSIGILFALIASVVVLPAFFSLLEPDRSVAKELPRTVQYGTQTTRAQHTH